MGNSFTGRKSQSVPSSCRPSLLCSSMINPVAPALRLAAKAPARSAFLTSGMDLCAFKRRGEQWPVQSDWSPWTGSWTTHFHFFLLKEDVWRSDRWTSFTGDCGSIQHTHQGRLLALRYITVYSQWATLGDGRLRLSHPCHHAAFCLRSSRVCIKAH